MKKLTRKNFLLGSGAAAASLVLPRCGPQRGAGTLYGVGAFDNVLLLDGGRSELDAGSDAGVADSGVADAGVADSGAADSGVADSGIADSGVADSGTPDAGDGGVTPQCPETAYDSIGPCYRPNAPLRTALSLPGDGAELFITGTVTAKGCVPIANALIDIWHANAQGTYSDMTVCGASMNGTTFRWRGRQYSLANGSWGIQSIYPGSFENRPIHLHLQVSAPGFVSLITQIYFLNDPFLGNEPPKPQVLVIPVQMIGTERHGVFNIGLAKVP